MADKAPTAANVRTSVIPKRGTAGVGIAAGDHLAIAADNSLQLFDANSGTPELRIFAGVAVCGAALGQPVLYVYQDPAFTPGYAIAAGDIVIGSATPGKACADADAASGWYKTFIGIGIGGNQMNLNPIPAGAPVP